MIVLLSAFVGMTCIAIPLTAQDVTVTPPVLFDMSGNPYQPDQPDTAPTLLENWSPSFPAELRTTTEPSYVVLMQALDEKGKRTALYFIYAYNDSHERSMWDMSNPPQCTPAQKNGIPVKSVSWISVIYNPASASEKNADATPRILKVVPILVTRKQMNVSNKSSLFVRGSIEIDTAGTAKNLRLEKNVPVEQALRPDIERSLAQWQFAPARKHGQPIDAKLTLTFVLQRDPMDAINDILQTATSYKAPANLKAPANGKPPDTMPVIIKQTAPKYPKAMQNSRMIGKVFVQFVVDTNGRVRSPEVSRSNNRNFEQPAIDAVLQWRFKPGTRDGKPVETNMAIQIQFTPP